MKRIKQAEHIRAETAVENIAVTQDPAVDLLRSDLRPGDVVIMDSLSRHKRVAVKEGTTRQGSPHQRAFSPPDQRVSGRSMVVINAIAMQPVT